MRNFCNEELYDLYCSPMYYSGSQIKKNEKSRARGTYEGEFWWENLRERDYLEDRRRWEDNIKMNIQEVGWGHGLD
jgi:hypothetical protein